jgi:hypothetical protein
MDLNNNFKQIEFLKESINGKKILIYGPSNEEISEQQIIKIFNKYDYIIIHNLFLDHLIKKIDISKFNIIHVLNGQYADDYKESIINNNQFIKFYLVSEIHTMHVLHNYGIYKNKVLHMANNYKLFNLSNPPHMGAKLLLFILYNELDFNEIKISGYTFYMNFDNINSIYNLNYVDFLPIYNNYKDTDEFKYLNNISYDKITLEDKKKLINKAVKESFNKDSHHSNIFEEWNLFLNFLYKYRNKQIKLDNTLKKILEKYPSLLKKDPF